MPNLTRHPFRTVSRIAALVLGVAAALPVASWAQTFHFESICRSDPAAKKNTVTIILHNELHAPLADVTVNALWSYVDYRQNHAVFRYKPVSCTTDRAGACTFNGGSGRARWQVSSVEGYDLGTPAFDNPPTTLCPNTFMIDFW